LRRVGRPTHGGDPQSAALAVQPQGRQGARDLSTPCRRTSNAQGAARAQDMQAIDRHARAQDLQAIDQLAGAQDMQAIDQLAGAQAYIYI